MAYPKTPEELKAFDDFQAGEFGRLEGLERDECAPHIHDTMTPVEIIVDLIQKPTAEFAFVLGDISLPDGRFEIFVNGRHLFVTVTQGE